jgi:hypothetical protein
LKPYRAAPTLDLLGLANRTSAQPLITSQQGSSTAFPASLMNFLEKSFIDVFPKIKVEDDKWDHETLPEEATFKAMRKTTTPQLPKLQETRRFSFLFIAFSIRS